jgi:hypothetical protein
MKKKQISLSTGGATSHLDPDLRRENPFTKNSRECLTVKSRDGPVNLFADRVVSLPEASAISGLSVDTLRRCHERKELRIIKLSPRRVGIRLSALWAFIDARAT